MGISFEQLGQAVVDPQRCSQCGMCVSTCPDKVLQMTDQGPVSGPGVLMGCIACGHCMAVCPSEAIGIRGRGLSPDDVFPLPAAERRAGLDGLEALMQARRSVRRFRADEVDRAVLQRIVDVAATAPMGIPPQEVGVIVVAGRQQVRQTVAKVCDAFDRVSRSLNPLMLALMRPFIGKVGYQMMRRFVRPLLRAIVEAHRQGEDAFSYDAPALMLFHHTPVADATDVAIVATYAMLAAEAAGLGSCMLGTVVALNHDKPIRRELNLPADNKVTLGLALGYPDVPFRRGIRRRLASVQFVD